MGLVTLFVRTFNLLDKYPLSRAYSRYTSNWGLARLSRMDVETATKREINQGVADNLARRMGDLQISIKTLYNFDPAIVEFAFFISSAAPQLFQFLVGG